jgi:hypothetical protein
MRAATPVGRVFLAYSTTDADLGQSIAEHLERIGCEVTSPFTQSAAGTLASLLPTLADVDAVIALLEAPTANVYYELGAAAALAKPLLLVGGAAVPFDVAQYPHLPSRTSVGWWRPGVDQFIGRLPRRAEATQGRSDDPAEGVEAFAELLRDPARLGVMGDQELLRLVAALLRHRGLDVQVLPKFSLAHTLVQPDLTATLPDGSRLVIECKSLPVGARASMDAVRQVQSYVDSLGGNARGVVATTASFTGATIHYAQASDKSVELWDGTSLVAMLREALGGVEPEPRRTD